MMMDGQIVKIENIRWISEITINARGRRTMEP